MRFLKWLFKKRGKLLSFREIEEIADSLDYSFDSAEDWTVISVPNTSGGFSLVSSDGRLYITNYPTFWRLYDKPTGRVFTHKDIQKCMNLWRYATQ